MAKEVYIKNKNRKYLVGYLSINIFFFLLITEAQSAQEFDTLSYLQKFDVAVNSYKEGRYKLAESYFKSILINDRNYEDPPAQLLMAKSQYNQNKFVEAIRSSNSLLSNYPNSVYETQILILLGDIFLKQEKFTIGFEYYLMARKKVEDILYLNEIDKRLSLCLSIGLREEKIEGLLFQEKDVSNRAIINLSRAYQAYYLGVNYDFNYRNKKWKWDNKIISSYGISHVNKQGFRKTDDRFEYNSIIALESIEEWYISFFSNFISQFSRGFDYSKDPRLEVSSIMSPAYFSFGPGILWRKNENLRVNIAPATSRFIFVSKPFSGMYGVPEGKRSIYGIGLNMSAFLKFKLMDNVTLENIIALYSDYIDNPQNIDINHQANFEVDVNKYLSVNLTLHLKSDSNASSKIQFRQLFGLGVNYTFHKI